MKKRRVTGSPTSVQILLTRNCGLNCIYCSADQFNRKEKEPELDTGEWISLLKRLKDIQVFSIAFSGGEIFLRDDIFEILETALKCNFPKIRLTSNGILISDTAAKQLKDLNFKDVSVSLDGDKETHERIRGSGSFAKAVEGIENLVNNGIIPQIQFTPLKMNYKALPDLVDILYPYGIRELSFNALHPTGRCTKIYKEIMADCFIDSEEMKKIVDDIRDTYRDFRIDDPPMFYHNFPKNYHENKIRGLLDSVEKPCLKPCSAGHSSCNITSSGWVIPCSELFDFRGGNIREQDILDIWKHSENFERIRHLSDVSIDEIPYCRNCDYNVFCNAGCRADAYAVSGDLLAPDPFCPYPKEK